MVGERPRMGVNFTLTPVMDPFLDISGSLEVSELVEMPSQKKL